MKSDRNTYITIFALVAIILTLLPFLVTFNESLTKLMEATPIYLLIQKYIVPYEIKIVASLLYLLKVPVTIQNDGLNVNQKYLQVTWNCLGWQSVIFLIISFLVGFQGSYTRISKAETVLIGLLGTFLTNILRIFMVSLLGAYLPAVFALIYHDYLAAFITVVWLFIYWWFCYGFVLDEH